MLGSQTHREASVCVLQYRRIEAKGVTQLCRVVSNNLSTSLVSKNLLLVAGRIRIQNVLLYIWRFSQSAILV
jgi:hypothetical protein